VSAVDIGDNVLCLGIVVCLTIVLSIAAWRGGNGKW
jgi:hypothetical protein